MRHICAAIFAFLLLMQTVLTVSAAPDVSTLEQARKEYICAWVSLSSYDGRIQGLARSELAAQGWHVQRFHQDTDKADAKFYMVSRTFPDSGETMHILAVTGTENAKDMKSDINFDKVPFDKGSASQVNTVTRSGQLDPDVPMVHKGFNDYTNTVLFTTDDQARTFGETLRKTLMSHPDERLILTGHSLGGAVATLMAARLIDSGVSPKQVEVISFGAPAVGNRLFAEKFRDTMQLNRVIVKNDPVKGVLQTVTSDYVQFGHKTEWSRNENSDQFYHSIAIYVDAALRNYYDIKNLTDKEDGKTDKRSQTAARPAVYAAPFHFRLDEAIQNDLPYMKQSLRDGLRRNFGSVVFAPEGDASVGELCRRAAAAGCSYVLVDQFSGTRIKNLPYAFKMTSFEMIYSTDGRLISTTASITNTGVMTPIEALLYNQVKAGRVSGRIAA